MGVGGRDAVGDLPPAAPQADIARMLLPRIPIVLMRTLDPALLSGTPRDDHSTAPG
jgi:hypothetical protein